MSATDIANIIIVLIMVLMVPLGIWAWLVERRIGQPERGWFVIFLISVGEIIGALSLAGVI